MLDLGFHAASEFRRPGHYGGYVAENFIRTAEAVNLVPRRRDPAGGELPSPGRSSIALDRWPVASIDTYAAAH